MSVQGLTLLLAVSVFLLSRVVPRVAVGVVLLVVASETLQDQGGTVGSDRQLSASLV